MTRDDISFTFHPTGYAVISGQGQSVRISAEALRDIYLQLDAVFGALGAEELSDDDAETAN